MANLWWLHVENLCYASLGKSMDGYGKDVLMVCVRMHVVCVCVVCVFHVCGIREV